MLRGCSDTITHSSLYDCRNPFGKYALSLEDAASHNIVRSLISMVCRRQGCFRHDTVYHSTQQGLERVSIPVTEYMKWEDWTVPNSGTAIFEFIAGQSKTSHSSMPKSEFERYQNLLRSEVSTIQRRQILQEVAENNFVLCPEQRWALLSDIRDLPERSYFMNVGPMTSPAQCSI